MGSSGSADYVNLRMRMGTTSMRVLFAQRDGGRSGEFFLAELEVEVDRSWPPGCGW